ncbi:MAG: hypothetical protein DMG29_12230 [Acidobacteria bacterium]|nr:MAG: hypothetical protein DMG29_12230 [Acidobacteriota bacterium]
MATRNVLIGVLSTLAASLTCVAQSFHSAARAARPTGSETLLVFPLENSSRLAKLEWLGEGLAELTIERLSHAGQFAFPREERLAAIEKLGLPASTRYSRATMLKIAEEVDADYVLFGHYSSDGKNFTVTAQVLHVDPPRLMPPLEESGALEELMEMHARLAWRVYCGVATASAGVAPCGRMALSQADFLSKFPPLRLDAFEYYIRGLLSPESEKDQQRLRDLREAARLEPGWDDPAFTLGQAYFARRDCASALPWLSRVPLAHERGPEAGFTAGVCHLLRNDAARAEAAFASLLVRGAINGRDTAGVAASGEGPARSGGEGCCALAEAFNNLGVARARLGKLREAVAAFERAAQLDPDEVDYWWNLGVIRMQANEPAPAVEAFREVLRRQTGDAEARALLIEALERGGQAAQAAGEREAFTRLGEPPASLPSLMASLHPFPETSAPIATQAVSPSGPGQSPLPQALSRRAQHSQLHLTRGRGFLAAGKLDDAKREFTEAVHLAPLASAAAHQGLAEIYGRQSRTDDAVRELRAALASRDDADLRIQLARLYMSQNRPGEARAELQAALKLDPAPKLQEEARQLLQQLEATNGPGEPR